jgi:hypothetical protein
LPILIGKICFFYSDFGSFSPASLLTPPIDCGVPPWLLSTNGGLVTSTKRERHKAIQQKVETTKRNITRGGRGHRQQPRGDDTTPTTPWGMTRGITNGGSVQGERERKATKGESRGNPRSGMSLSLHWWKATKGEGRLDL